MAGPTPEENVDVTAVHQSWRQVAFLHWRVDAAVLAELLPAAVVPDLIDGSAWVSLTPFRVERFRVLGLPPGPLASSFHETNLRTYVRDGDGTDGLWFFSLDVDSAVNVLGGRAGTLPYFPATMSVEGPGDDGTVRYRSRRDTGAGHHDITVRPGVPLDVADPADPAHLLTGRWRAFNRVAGQALVAVPVQHEPWPLHTAELVSLEEDLLAATGLPEPDDPPLVHYAPGVDAHLGLPRPARAAA